MRRIPAVALLVLFALTTHAREVLPFVENDYAKAVATAKAKKLPLFVEAWAPWCHTCRSMQAYVYTDQKLAPYAGKFVWLSIDTENAKNAAFLKKFPIPALPTLLVLDPGKESVALRYVGGATVPQLSKLLDDGERAAHGNHISADVALARADRLANEGKSAEAAKAYDEALNAAPKEWSRRARASESLIFTLSGDSERCASRAAELYPRLRGTLSGANVASGGLGCAIELPETNSKRAALLTTLTKDTRESFDDPKIEMAADDRSGLFIALIAAREDAKDDAGAHKLKEEWVAFLEGAAAKAKSPEQRAVYDSHRLSGYMDLGTPEKAIPMLEQSKKDFPSDYNPWARLALAYKTMKQYDKALAASDQALSMVYGPRKIGVLRTRADIYAAAGRKEESKKTIEEAIAFAQSLPEGQRNERTIASLKKALDTM